MRCTRLCSLKPGVTGHLVPTRTTTQLVSLALITNVLGTRIEEEEK
jgi:hypothetical protein